MHYDIIYEGWRGLVGTAIALGLIGACNIALAIFAPGRVLALLDGDIFCALGIRPPFRIIPRSWEWNLRRAIFGLSGVALAACGLYLGYTRVLRPLHALHSGTAHVVSGAVSDVTDTRFTLAGLRFANPGNALQSAYVAAAQRGSSVQSRLHVRVTYLGDRTAPEVLRIEAIH